MSLPEIETTECIDCVGFIAFVLGAGGRSGVHVLETVTEVHIMCVSELSRRPAKRYVPWHVCCPITRVGVLGLRWRRTFPLIQLCHVMRCQCPVVYAELIDRPGKEAVSLPVHTRRELVE